MLKFASYIPAGLLLIIELFSVGLSYRLPTIYNPSKYVLQLTVPEDVFTEAAAVNYTGSVEITFKVTEETKEIQLHASDDYISPKTYTLQFSNGTEKSYTFINYIINGTTEILTFSLEESLDIDSEYTLTIDFGGILSTADMHGFYKSSYVDKDNKTQYLATTQFEPTYARRAFPCFDEPSYKAVFEVSITYPKGQNVLANMAKVGDELSDQDNNTVATVTFKPTPIMSTYLLAFIVSPFTCTSDETLESTLVNQVCSRSEAESTRTLALETAPLAIDFLNTYLGVNYSSNIDKLDQVAIPDFSAGAMENWGLVTYRERALLYDADETAMTYYQYITTVVSHELAHQWFGNLVTCKWWSEIFLNEGFATFFEYFATHDFHPEMELDKQFVTTVVQYAFGVDADGTEALHTDALTQSDISARFSTVSYDKGGSILRMVEHIMGTDAWKAGLNTYLTTYAHKSAEPIDLFTILSNAITADLPKNLTEVVDSWIENPGFPVVNVALNGNELTLTQERFTLSNTTVKNTTWYIPITYTTSADQASTFDDTTPKAWITPDAPLIITLPSAVSWIVVNNQETGYYRVNYDETLWENLAEALIQDNFSGIPEINRAQIVDDAFNLARGGYITYDQLFSVITFLANETSYHVWYPTINGFEYLLSRTGQDSPLGEQIKNHLLRLETSALSSFPITKVNDSNHIYSLTQVLLNKWACQLNNTDCTIEAVRLFSEYRTSSTRPNKNLRTIAYCYGLKNSEDIAGDWEFLWNQFLTSTLSTEQVTILAALGCTTDSDTITKYLSKTLADDSGMRSQDYAAVFSSVYSGSSVGPDYALDFFTTNLDAILSRYTSLNGIGNILKGIAAKFTTTDQIAKLQALIDSNRLSDTVLVTATTAVSTAQSNLAWLDTQKYSLDLYYGLETSSSPTTPTTSTTTTGTTGPSTSTTESSSNQAAIYLTLIVMSLISLLL